MAESQTQTQRTLTKYGGLVLAFATERGITTQRALAEAVSAAAGEDVSQRRMSSWLHGEHEPPWWFNEALAEVLDLSEEKMNRLAWANTWWIKKPIAD